MDLQEKIQRMNKRLASCSIEELQARADEHNKKARQDFEKLKP